MNRTLFRTLQTQYSHHPIQTILSNKKKLVWRERNLHSLRNCLLRSERTILGNSKLRKSPSKKYNYESHTHTSRSNFFSSVRNDNSSGVSESITKMDRSNGVSRNNENKEELPPLKQNKVRSFVSKYGPTGIITYLGVVS